MSKNEPFLISLVGDGLSLVTASMRREMNCFWLVESVDQLSVKNLHLIR